MIKKRFLLISLILCTMLMQSCNFPFKASNDNKNNILHKDNVENTIKNSSKNTNEEKKQKHISKFTGELVSSEEFNRIPFMVIIENSKSSRPQHGLNSADIIYETAAEGGIPRFIALFQKNACKKIGPVRSARNYFIDIANEYNLPFAHCGGSEEALNRIIQNKEKSINEIPNPRVFFRDKSRKPPHNLYVSSKNLWYFIKNQNYSKSNNTTLKFDSNYWDDTNLPAAEKITITPNKYYNTSYSIENNIYLKNMDGKKSIDASTDEPLYTNNIVIQFTDIILQKDGLHLSIKLQGSGNAYVISNGKYKKVKWHKKNKTSPTLLIDENNHIVPLSPGKTWWHIIDKSSKVDIH